MRLPPCLDAAAPDQRRDVQAALRRLPDEQRQPVLDELEARAQSGTVRNVVAYLFGLVRRVLAGEFRLWAAKKPTSAVPVAPPLVARPLPTGKPAPVLRPSTPEVAQTHIALARRILRMPAPAGELAAELMQTGPGAGQPCLRALPILSCHDSSEAGCGGVQ